jgi:hypothetical protein
VVSPAGGAKVKVKVKAGWAIPLCRAGAELGKPTDSADGPGETTADTRRTRQVDDIPSITLIRGESIILITLIQLPDQPMFTQPPYR